MIVWSLGLPPGSRMFTSASERGGLLLGDEDARPRTVGKDAGHGVLHVLELRAFLIRLRLYYQDKKIGLSVRVDPVVGAKSSLHS